MAGVSERLTHADGYITIICATTAMLDAEDEGGAAVAAMLEVGAPESWPPEHNGPETRAWLRGLMAEHPDEPGFAAWYIVADGRLAGTCGYTGPPDGDGVVEIGYAVIPERQRRGFATVAARLLTRRAFTDERVRSVTARTLATGEASQKVLLGCGFVATGPREDSEEGEMIRFVAERPQLA